MDSALRQNLWTFAPKLRTSQVCCFSWTGIPVLLVACWVESVVSGLLTLNWASAWWTRWEEWEGHGSSNLSILHLEWNLCSMSRGWVEEGNPHSFSCIHQEFSLCSTVKQNCREWEILESCWSWEDTIALDWEIERGGALLYWPHLPRLELPSSLWEMERGGREQVVTQVPQTLCVLRFSKVSWVKFLHLLYPHRIICCMPLG